MPGDVVQVQALLDRSTMLWTTRGELALPEADLAGTGASLPDE
jgi:hypothetical protein